MNRHHLMHRIAKYVTIVAVVTVLMLIAFYSFLVLALYNGYWNASRFDVRTFIYIKSYIRSVPRINMVTGTDEYSTHFQDGEQPGDNCLSYQSADSVPAVFTAVEQHLLRQGFTREMLPNLHQSADVRFAGYAKEYEKADLSVSLDAGHTSMRVCDYYY